MKLTETSVRNIKTQPKQQLISDDAVPGLYLKVYTSGRKSWLYRTRKGGSWKVTTLGTFPEMSLAAARRQSYTAPNALTVVDAPDTFATLLDKWYAKRAEPRYANTVNAQTYIARGKKTLGGVPLDKLTTKALVSALQEYADAAPVAANRCLTIWKAALGYGVQTGLLERNPLSDTSTRVVGGEETPRDRVLTDDEIRALMAANMPAAQFLLYTGLRVGEMTTGRLEGDRWVLDTSKTGKAHWVHLPAAALALAPKRSAVRVVQHDLRIWRDQNRHKHFTAHDLRRTCATRMAGLGVALHVVEKVLNHSLGGMLAVYNHNPYEKERVDAAELWAAELERICNGA